MAEKVGINCSCFTVGKLINPAAGWQWMAAIWVPYGHGMGYFISNPGGENQFGVSLGLTVN